MTRPLDFSGCHAGVRYGVNIGNSPHMLRPTIASDAQKVGAQWLQTDYPLRVMSFYSLGAVANPVIDASAIEEPDLSAPHVMSV